MDPKNNLNSVYPYTSTFQDQVTLPNSPDKSMNVLNNNEQNKVKNLNYSTVPPTQSYYKPIKSNETSYIPVNQIMVIPIIMEIHMYQIIIHKNLKHQIM